MIRNKGKLGSGSKVSKGGGLGEVSVSDFK